MIPKLRLAAQGDNIEGLDIEAKTSSLMNIKELDIEAKASSLMELLVYSCCF